jgi:hypothetical protein
MEKEIKVLKRAKWKAMSNHIFSGVRKSPTRNKS